mgnify:CR=1 FL=1
MLSFSKLKCQVFISVLLGDLCHSKFKVLLGNMDSPLSKSEHSCLSANGLALSSRSSWHHFGDLGQINTSHKVHLTRMDFQDVKSGLLVRVGELNLSIDTAWTEQGIIENVDSVCCHDNLDLIGGFETVKLVQKLQHGSLNLRISFTALDS